LLIGELGWLSVNNTINHQQPQWFNKLWKDLLRYVDEGCIGGIYFEYSDEKYKASGLDQTQLGVVEIVESINSQGQSSTTSNVFIADKVVRKQIIFDAVKQGVLDGVPMNFNMDLFSYLKRDQATIKTTDKPPVVPMTPIGGDDEPSGAVPTSIPSPPSPSGASPKANGKVPNESDRLSIKLVVAFILICVFSLLSLA